MDSLDALWIIARVRASGRRFTEEAQEFLTELAEDLADARKPEPTPEDLTQLRDICRRAGVEWHEEQMPETA